MQTLQEVNVEDLARLFHHYKEALAHSAWEQAPESERKLTVAAIRLALLELSTAAEPRKPNRKYFAEPGEADWGC